MTKKISQLPNKAIPAGTDEIEINAGGTSNKSPISALYARAQHTGTQLASTISDFNAAVQLNKLDSLAAPDDTTTRDATTSLHGLMPKADKTKIDGIESGATADQTGAEIKTAYQAETNAYTDTKNTKLNGIATGAEVNPALISQAEAEAGVATTERIFSALRVKQAIESLGKSAFAVASLGVATNFMTIGNMLLCVFGDTEKIHTGTVTDKEQIVPVDMTFNNVRIDISVNTLTSVTSVRLRVNNVVSAEFISIPSMSTGKFSNTTVNVSVNAGDLICWDINPGTNQNLTVDSISAKATLD